ncbi:MAG: TIGR01777 family oxidoreductase [Bdellovibrionales bacterium]|nr:TIGR01777 family oxidoreductase [Bdellovibrionales bacterium]
MKFLVTGATGLVGRKIAKRWTEKGHELVVLTGRIQRARASFPYPARFFEWDAEKGEPPADAFEGVHGIIHLAGESVAQGRWNPERKARIRDSRVAGSRNLFTAALEAKTSGRAPLKTIVSASAIGFYGDRGHEILDETSAKGKGFLSDVTWAWEDETLHSPMALALKKQGVRLAALRIGMVLAKEGGALKELLPLYRKGLGGPVGSGNQWVSWIHIEDLVSAFEAAAMSPQLEGPINAVAPKWVTNAQFAKTLGKALDRPAILPAPAFALKLALGEMSELVLGSQRVDPVQLNRSGFQFRYPSLEEAFRDLLGKPSA